MLTSSVATYSTSMSKVFVFSVIFASLENVIPYTTQPPCCRDHLGSSACQKTMHQNLRMFAKRCNTDAEFRLIQCCSTCNHDGVGIAYDLIARSLVSEHCFDRYGPQFCNRYVNKTDVFEPHNTWSCDGENPQIAFRTCRRSCGYCNFSVIQYTLENSLQACKRGSASGSGSRWRSKFSTLVFSTSAVSSTRSPVDIINSTYNLYN